jgi:hypothetical protein
MNDKFKRLETNLKAIEKINKDLYNRLLDVDFVDKKKFYKKEELNDLPISSVKHPRLGIVLGFGLGYHFGVKADKSKMKNVIVIEESLAIFKTALLYTDISGAILSKKLHLLVGIDINKLHIEFGSILFRNQNMKSDYKTFSFIPYIYKNKEYYFKAVKIVKEAFLTDLINYGTSVEDSLIGLENLLENKDYTLNNPGIILLKDKFKGKTAILVAAGPSLKKNMHLLKEVGDKALIICVDTALKILLKEGIYPHIVTSIERGISVMNYFDDLEDYLPRLKDVYFAPATVLRKEIFDKCLNDYGMKSLIVYRDFKHYEWLGVDKGTVRSGKSSANLAFCMLNFMGFKKVVLIGQDLAFDGDKTHVEGASHSIKGMKASPKIKEEMWVKGNYKEKIKTIQTWYNFLKYYESDIHQFDIDVINATEGGAYINGTRLKTFKSVIKEDLATEIDVEKTIQEGIDKFSEEQKEKDKEIVLNIIDNTYNFSEEIFKYCYKNINKIEKFIKEFKKYKKEDLVDKEYLYNPVINEFKIFVNDINKNADRICSHPYFSLFYMHTVQSKFISHSIEMNYLVSKPNHELEFLEKNLEWFESMKAFSRISLKYLEKHRSNYE